MIVRTKVDQALRERLVVDLCRALASRIKKHGEGAFVGPHEGLAVVTEEFLELGEACRSNDRRRVREEALDVAIAAAWLVASLDALEAERTT